MARPCCCRKVGGPPRCSRFEPRGGAAPSEGPVVLGLDELEALRLADVEGLEQEPAAERMGVSRPTFGRVLASARRKAAQALVEGRALSIEGGAVHEEGATRYTCGACGHRWAREGAAGPCPRCRGRGARPCGCAGAGGGGEGGRREVQSREGESPDEPRARSAEGRKGREPDRSSPGRCRRFDPRPPASGTRGRGTP